MKKTFITHYCPNKDIIIKVRYTNGAQIILRYCYNTIANTYSGTMVEDFVENIRGLLRVCPDFFEVMESFDPEKSLLELGFIQTLPTDVEIKVMDMLNQ